MADRRLLAGRYRVEAVLGHGGMAQVYRGTDQVLGRPIAVKVLAPQYARDPSFVARFRREAQSAAALNHPNVVSVFDTGSEDGTHFIVMEYVQGRTLAEVIREGQAMLPERAAEIAESVAAALAFAHAAGIVHRDVKPGNIMLTKNGDVKVMDFGIARATTTDSITQTATVLGTATYFSPEQAQGEAVDARSDVYSLGVVLYEMITGHPPFTGESPVTIAYKHVREDPVPPSRINSDVPPALDAIVVKCLAKNPANRYQSAEELRRDLERFRNGLPVAATPLMPVPTEVVERTSRPTTILPPVASAPVERSRRWVALLILAIILGLIAVGLFFLARSLTSPTEVVTVPDVRGRTLPVARDILQRNGFRVGSVDRELSETVPKDRVIDFDPKEAELGAAIDLLVSLGPETMKVPNVVCEKEDEARADLVDAGFDVQVRTAQPEENRRCPGEGFVARQEPPAGAEADPGSTVRIFVQPAPSPSPSESPSPTPSESPSPSPPPSESPSPSPPPSESPSPSPPQSPTPTGGADASSSRSP